MLEGSQEVCMLWSAMKSDNLVEFLSKSLYTSFFLCMYTCTCMHTVYAESIVIYKNIWKSSTFDFSLLFHNLRSLNSSINCIKCITYWYFSLTNYFYEAEEKCSFLMFGMYIVMAQPYSPSLSATFLWLVGFIFLHMKSYRCSRLESKLFFYIFAVGTICP